MKRLIVLLFAALVLGGTEAVAQSARHNAAAKTAEKGKKAKADKKIKTSEADTSKDDEAETHVQQLGWLDKRYVFGVATSYADSVTMVTMVNEVDSMAYDVNTKVPLGIDLYTDSFRNYLEAQGRTGYICSTFVCTTEREAERKLTAICNRVNKKKRTKLTSVDGFLYHRIATEHIYTNAGQ